ncbi:hypothetical protein R0131_04845 [Clostridium sp. AL.422]|uniref:hypothetical protein n=1 Tax=Clostridium TaxID=1485 RepID=UPI00293DDD94|nr:MULTISPECIES: hypothetical protein [unclassified Clostridium]MDV4150160.1 hypothetical protein [Clostridium sp. AL.422]
MKDKDIYEILNDIEVETPIEETPLSNLQLKRIRKHIKRKAFRNRKKYLIAALIFFSFIFVVSPLGNDVIAKIKEKLAFNSAYGIISVEENKDLYMLKEPFTVSINNKDMLVKSINNNGDGLFIQIIGEAYPIEAKEIIYDIGIKLENGETKGYDSYGFSASSGSVVMELWMDIRESDVKDFDLIYKDNVLKEVSLDKADYKYNYDDIGGNTTNNGILIGGTSYYIENKRYFRIWSDESSLLSKDYDVRIGHITIKEVRDENGKLLSFEPSNEGTWNEYKILDNYRGKINIKVEEVDLSYTLNTPTEIKINDPEKNGDYILDKELTFVGIEDKIKVTEIKKVKNDIVVCFDLSNNDSNDRLLYLLSDNSRSGSGMGDRENMIAEIDLDYADLSLYEKLTGNITVNINNLDILQKGNWEFTIE